jgi:hypothetical protein
MVDPKEKFEEGEFFYLTNHGRPALRCCGYEGSFKGRISTRL